MRAAILTFSTAENYGAQLQAFGLQSALRSVGVEAFHIRLRQDKKPQSLKGVVRDFLSKAKENSYMKFQKEHLSFFKGEYDHESIVELNECFDAFISGSDQVFNMKNGVNPVYFQEFVEPGHLKISYAASMGIKEVPMQYRKRVGTDLDGFNALSVREQDAVEELRKLTKIKIMRNIDPVFLLERHEWDKICAEPDCRKPYIFVYGTEMTEEIINVALKLSKETGYGIYSVFPMRGAKPLYLKIGPAEFIGYIKNAAYVVTTSFHCTAFSMIYEKNLIEVLHRTTGSRARGLLELVDKEECVYNGADFNLTGKLDYGNTRQIIEMERNAGLEFLREQLT